MLDLLLDRNNSSAKFSLFLTGAGLALVAGGLKGNQLLGKENLINALLIGSSAYVARWSSEYVGFSDNDINRFTYVTTIGQLSYLTANWFIVKPEASFWQFFKDYLYAGILIGGSELINYNYSVGTRLDQVSQNFPGGAGTGVQSTSFNLGNPSTPDV